MVTFLESVEFAGSLDMTESRTSTLLGMDRGEITALVSEAGEAGYRAKQIMDAVYRQRVEMLGEDFYAAAEVSRATGSGAAYRLGRRGSRRNLSRLMGPCGI